ncbi:hypothetical protein V2G26_003838 [Clonostachys chloroleuca]
MLPRLVHLLIFSAVGTALYVRRGAQSQHDTTITGSNLHERAATLAPIDTSPADGITGGRVANSLPPLDSFIVDLKPPFPTNTWWAPYLAQPGDQNAAGPFPYQSSLGGSGVKFGVSTDRHFDGTSIQQPVRIDWLVGFTEHQGSFSGHKATKFDEQTVTVQYFQGNARMNAFLVPGSPYMTFEYEGATPKLEPQNASIKSFNGKSVGEGSAVTESGTVFIVTDTEDATYVIYALETVTLRASPDAITADVAYNNVIRLAKVSQESHRVLLDQYHSAYPTAAKLEYELGNTEGAIVFSWETVGSGELLMLTWPHHRGVMQNGNFPPTSALGYLTTKGWMYPALGKQWRLTYKLSDVVWNPTRKLDSSCSDAVIKGLEYEVSQLKTSDAPVPNDFYYWGGTLAAKSRLALIADDLGRQDLIAPVIGYLKTSFQPWFEYSHTTQAAYETAWGGIINKAGATNEFVDFGNGYYNDHHFHYGYVLAIAATIAKYDQGWLNQHKTFINWFARDIINASPSDPQFPHTRCRDWFAGHSWASGILNGAGSRNQESSTEAVNGYYGAMLWASVAINQDYANFAKLLVASEQQATRVYWHLYPQKSSQDLSNPYPEDGLRNLATIGNVLDWQSGAFLWWGNQKVQIAAIQILPLIPINEALYDEAWVRNMWSYTMPELVDPAYGDEWKNLIVAAYANAEPQIAAAWSSNITNWGSGNTFTNQLHFIGTRPNPSGQPICGNLAQNPMGNLRVRVAGTNDFVVVESDNILKTGAEGNAAVFDSAYVPNSGTLQLTSTGRYVTADQSASGPLTAGAAVASTWERFTIRPKAGAGSGVYTIKAASNGRYVVRGSDGRLVNSAVSEADGTGFSFV